MKLKKKYKLVIVFLCNLIFALLIYLIFFHGKSYSITYERDGFNVKEIFDRQKKIYEFEVQNDKTVYQFSFSNKYKGKRLIKNVYSIENEDEEKCVYPKSKSLSFYPVCYNNGEFFDYDLTSIQDDEFYKREKSQVEKSDYKNIEINIIGNHKYLVWAHKGYYYISNKEKKDIMFLENESYYNNLAFKTREYVITPNYDEEYAFSTIYVINLKNGKLSTWKLDESINFNCYYLGEKDGIVYIFDKKEKKEFALNIKSKKMELVSKDGYGKVWNDGWERMSLTKLANNDYKFTSTKAHNFNLENSNILVKGATLSNNMSISKRKVKSIVYSGEEEVYYLVDDVLFGYSFKKGEEELLKYSEWNFNTNNSVFIYNF